RAEPLLAQRRRRGGREPRARGFDPVAVDQDVHTVAQLPARIAPAPTRALALPAAGDPFPVAVLPVPSAADPHEARTGLEPLFARRRRCFTRAQIGLDPAAIDEDPLVAALLPARL